MTPDVSLPADEAALPPGAAAAVPALPHSNAWRRFTARFAGLLEWLLIATVAILVVPVTMQIISRFTALIPSYIWTEELARFLFIWMIMIGAMLGVREMAHFNVDLWADVSPRLNSVLNLLTNLFTLAFALVFVVSGFEFTRFGLNRISELAELPLWLIHVAWPLTGLAWIAFTGEQVVDNWRALRGGEAP